MSAVKNICILGSTGSIGQSTLAVIAAAPEYRVFALTAHSNTDALLEQCLQFKPRYAVISDPAQLDVMAAKLQQSGSATELLGGPEALEQVASDSECDTVMAAIVGAAGLASSLAAVRAGKRVLLANKEALVMAGDLFMEAARASNAVVIPIDSEHNAIFQCLPSVPGGLAAEQLKAVEKVVLTGFRRSVSGNAQRIPGGGNTGTGLPTPEMVHGAQDIGGFRHHDEQGPGIH